MRKVTWQKRLEAWRSRLYLYPAPKPMPRKLIFWIALGLVGLMAIIFSNYFIQFVTTKQDAFLTGAEDMGIMDQAIWSVTHWQLLHQTICNVVSDTNCYNAAGISRFAIHFEPILFPVSLLYLIWAGPKTLLILQILVVASGAFPAFLLARLRLRNELAAVVIALIYLLFPAQQQATVFEFHAVTFTASLLLFTLYFLYTRRTLWLFVFAILAMACKEEIPLIIACFGLWSIIFQYRWRTGAGLVLLATGWVGITLLMYRLFSPTGHSLLISRYAYLGSGPLEVVRNIALHPVSLIYQHVLEHTHRQYLRELLAPVGYVPLLAPWILILAAPSLAINLFSTDPNQYLGVFQYSAEIVPVLIFATIEGIVVIIWALRWFMDYVREWNEQAQPGDKQVATPRPHYLERWVRLISLYLLVVFVLLNVVRHDQLYGALPITRGFHWPPVTSHNALAERFISMIPPSASVSAQSSLVPHLSERPEIYLFPYEDEHADYIFLDITSFPYPYQISAYTSEVKKVMLSQHYGVVAAQDGFLLLKRGLPSPAISVYSPVEDGDDAVPDLPDNFCSFAQITQLQVIHPLHVDFSVNAASSANISLVGYDVLPPNSFNVITPYMQVTAYWKVNTPNLPPLRVKVLLTDKNGKEQFSSVDFPALKWCPTSSWKPGMIVRTTSSNLPIANVPGGLTHVQIALMPFVSSSGTRSAVTDGFPFQIVKAPRAVTPVKGANALQLDSFIMGH